LFDSIKEKASDLLNSAKETATNISESVMGTEKAEMKSQTVDTNLNGGATGKKSYDSATGYTAAPFDATNTAGDVTSSRAETAYHGNKQTGKEGVWAADKNSASSRLDDTTTSTTQRFGDRSGLGGADMTSSSLEGNNKTFGFSSSSQNMSSAKSGGVSGLGSLDSDVSSSTSSSSWKDSNNKSSSSAGWSADSSKKDDLSSSDKNWNKDSSSTSSSTSSWSAGNKDTSMGSSSSNASGWSAGDNLKNNNDSWSAGTKKQGDLSSSSSSGWSAGASGLKQDYATKLELDPSKDSSTKSSSWSEGTQKQGVDGSKLGSDWSKDNAWSKGKN